MGRAIRFNVRMRYLPLTAAAALAAACALVPATAQGQGGQRPDPDSPAGVEYQLPLEQARKNAAGEGTSEPRGGGADPGGRAGPLFGAGIVARKVEKGRGDETRAGSEDGDGGSEPGSAGSRADGEDDAGEDSGGGDPPISRSAVGAADSDDATLRTVGIALAVLLAGGLLGIGLRRGLRQSGQ